MQSSQNKYLLLVIHSFSIRVTISSGWKVMLRQFGRIFRLPTRSVTWHLTNFFGFKISRGSKFKLASISSWFCNLIKTCDEVQFSSDRILMLDGRCRFNFVSSSSKKLSKWERQRKLNFLSSWKSFGGRIISFVSNIKVLSLCTAKPRQVSGFTKVSG